MELVEATGRYARLTLWLPSSGEELEMDLLKEALVPRFVTVQVTARTSVRALSLEDTVGLKARAWHDRFVIRDIIDLHAAAGTFSYIDLERLARRHEAARQSWIISLASASSLTKTSPNMSLVKRRSQISAGGSRDDMTTWLAVSPRNSLVSFRTTYDGTDRTVTVNERPAAALIGSNVSPRRRLVRGSQVSGLLAREASTRSRNPSTASHSSFSG